MKKCISLLLSLILMLSPLCSAFAEQEKGGLLSDAWDSFSSWAQNAWEDASGWASDAWEDASGWASDAWEDAAEWAGGAWSTASEWAVRAWNEASKWIAQAWESTSSWVSEIWGDASEWASHAWEDASDTVRVWWTRTFGTVTDRKNAWKWLRAVKASAEGSAVLQQIRQLSSLPDSQALQEIRSLYQKLLKDIGIVLEDIEKIWNTICAYARQRNISELEALVIVLPYLLELKEETAQSSDVPAQPVDLAVYLIAGLEKLGLKSEEDASELILSLENTLEEL